eukprot:365915-Chlamydomonas_euryale.AAC.4
MRTKTSTACCFSRLRLQTVRARMQSHGYCPGNITWHKNYTKKVALAASPGCCPGCRLAASPGYSPGCCSGCCLGCCPGCKPWLQALAASPATHVLCLVRPVRSVSACLAPRKPHKAIQVRVEGRTRSARLAYLVDTSASSPPVCARIYSSDGLEERVKA